LKTLEFVDALKTGAENIDKQHMALVDMINTLIESKDQNHTPESISLALTEMQKYVFVHFRDEEKYMQDNNFAGLEEHIKIHNVFENKVLEFKGLYEQGRTDLLEGVIEFLTDWLVAHIQGVDCAMVQEILGNR